MASDISTMTAVHIERQPAFRLSRLGHVSAMVVSGRVKSTSNRHYLDVRISRWVVAGRTRVNVLAEARL
jgi:hypothetical protein